MYMVFLLPNLFISLICNIPLNELHSFNNEIRFTQCPSLRQEVIFSLCYYSKHRYPISYMSKRGNIIQLLLLISGSVELNPGPDIRYKCIECYKSVNIGRSIACDNCNQWFHKSCLNMNSINFESYRNDNTQ